MSSPCKLFITGATGFLGNALLRRLGNHSGLELLAVVRRGGINLPEGVTQVLAPDNDVFSTDLALQNIQVVIHLAARAHILHDTCPDPLSAFREINVDGTLRLARQALAAGVRRFIFISSIGVNGSSTLDEPFDELSLPSPHADYAFSKFEAEQELLKLVEGTPMELVIIRPPLVYAGHAPGNFARLLKLVGSGVPLPFAAMNNGRSMIALENLVDFIALCVEHPAAANQLFLISDGIDVSTAEIVRFLAAGMNRKAHLFSVPDALMRCGASLLGKQAIYTQLCGSLAIDSSKARNLLGWKPKKTPAEALFEAGREFKMR